MKNQKIRRGIRGFCAVLILALTVTCAWNSRVQVVHATEDKKTDEKELTDEEKKMKEELDAAYKIKTESNDIPNWPQGPGTYGEAAIVMEVGTGAILYAKNIDAHFYPASITKLLTALVAFENADLTDEVRVTESSVDFLEWDDARIDLKPGNKLSLKDAMYALLLASANDAAHAIGESVGENAGHDYDWFIQQMNKRCKELGGENSNFVNTNGLHDENHYTCARDMALIAKELYKYPEVFPIMQTLEYTIPKSKTIDEHYFYQYHQMLMPANENYYEYAIGGKTGYTDQALSTLVTMTDNDDMQLVCVVLKTHGVNVYPDTRHLCDYAYENFHKVSVADNEKSKDVEKILDDDTGYVVLPDSVTFDQLDMTLTPDDTTCETSTEATLEYSYQGQYVGTARAKLSKDYIKAHAVKTTKKASGEKGADSDITAKTEQVPDTLIGKTFYQIKNYFLMEDGNLNVTRVVLVGCIALWILLVILMIHIIIKRKRRKRRH